MSETTKIEFSPHQWQCITNTAFFKAKAEISQIVKTYFGQLSLKYKQVLERQNSLRLLNNSLSPKISSGENHGNLPYITLDYPRLLTDDKNFMITRTFFWWGNGISLQLIVSGKYTEMINGVNACAGAWVNIDGSALWNNEFKQPRFAIISTNTQIHHLPSRFKIAYTWNLENFLDDDFANQLLHKFELLSTLTN